MDETKELTAAEKRKATMEAKKAAKENAENGGGEKDTAPTTTSAPASYRLRILNNSQCTQIIPICKGRRIVIQPGQHYDPEDQDYETIKKFVGTPFFKSLEGRNLLKIVDTPISKIGDPNFAASKTPKPPKDLDELPDHVTQADITKDEG